MRGEDGVPGGSRTGVRGGGGGLCPITGGCGDGRLASAGTSGRRSPMRHGRQRRSLWAAAGGDAVVAEVGSVAPGRAVRLARLPISRYLAWGLPWWLRW